MNKSEVRTLRPAAYARTCRTRLRPPHAIHSIENRKSIKDQAGRINGPLKKTHGEDAAEDLSQRDFHGTIGP